MRGIGAFVIAAAAALSTHGERASGVTFRATEFAFAGPDTIAAGAVVVHLANDGREPHQLSIYRLAAGADAGAVMRALMANQGRPPGVTKVGGIENARPGGADSVAMSLEPGTYLLLCGFPSPDGRPHVSRGMVRALVARGRSPGARALPPADVTMKLTDYDFVMSSPLHAGTQRIRVENAGRQHHQLIVSRLHPGVTLADVDRWDGKSAPPFDDVGGVAPMDPGEANVWTVTLAPGDYLLSCILLDVHDHKPHFMHGMEKVVHVAPRT
jgi:hypothetical protein